MPEALILDRETSVVHKEINHMGKISQKSCTKNWSNSVEMGILCHIELGKDSVLGW